MPNAFVQGSREMNVQIILLLQASSLRKNHPYIKHSRTVVSILQEKNSTDTHDESSEGAGDIEAISGTSERSWGGGGGVLDWYRCSSTNLDLSIRDLSDWGSSRGWGLDLSVGNLSNWSTSIGRSLDLSVGNLSNWSTSIGGGLNLSVRDLSDWSSGVGWGLDLSVGDLSDGVRLDGDDLGLAISVLGDWDWDS